MEKIFLTFVRWVGLAVTSIALIVVIGGGIAAYQEYCGIQGDAQAPEVEFSNFKTFKNFVPEAKDTVALVKKQDAFYATFDEHYGMILENITAYANSVNQPSVNAQEFEKYLFNLVSKYDYDIKTSYIKQLSVQTKNLAEYGEEIHDGATVKTIEWTNFLNWFSQDFDTQLREELNKRATAKSTLVTIEASLFTTLIMVGVTFVAFMFFILTVLLLKIEANTRKEEIKTEKKPPLKKK